MASYSSLTSDPRSQLPSTVSLLRSASGSDPFLDPAASAVTATRSVPLTRYAGAGVGKAPSLAQQSQQQASKALHPALERLLVRTGWDRPGDASVREDHSSEPALARMRRRSTPDPDPFSRRTDSDDNDDDPTAYDDDDQQLEDERVDEGLQNRRRDPEVRRLLRNISQGIMAPPDTRISPDAVRREAIEEQAERMRLGEDGYGSDEAEYERQRSINERDRDDGEHGTIANDNDPGIIPTIAIVPPEETEPQKSEPAVQTRDASAGIKEENESGLSDAGAGKATKKPRLPSRLGVKESGASSAARSAPGSRRGSASDLRKVGAGPSSAAAAAAARIPIWQRSNPSLQSSSSAKRRVSAPTPLRSGAAAYSKPGPSGLSRATSKTSVGSASSAASRQRRIEVKAAKNEQEVEVQRLRAELDRLKAASAAAADGDADLESFPGVRNRGDRHGEIGDEPGHRENADNLDQDYGDRQEDDVEERGRSRTREEQRLLKEVTRLREELSRTRIREVEATAERQFLARRLSATNLAAPGMGSARRLSVSQPGSPRPSSPAGPAGGSRRPSLSLAIPSNPAASASPPRAVASAKPTGSRATSPVRTSRSPSVSKSPGRALASPAPAIGAPPRTASVATSAAQRRSPSPQRAASPTRSVANNRALNLDDENPDDLVDAALPAWRGILQARLRSIADRASAEHLRLSSSLLGSPDAPPALEAAASSIAALNEAIARAAAPPVDSDGGVEWALALSGALGAAVSGAARACEWGAGAWDERDAARRRAAAATARAEAASTEASRERAEADAARSETQKLRSELVGLRSQATESAALIASLHVQLASAIEAKDVAETRARAADNAATEAREERAAALASSARRAQKAADKERARVESEATSGPLSKQLQAAVAEASELRDRAKALEAQLDDWRQENAKLRNALGSARRSGVSAAGTGQRVSFSEEEQSPFAGDGADALMGSAGADRLDAAKAREMVRALKAQLDLAKDEARTYREKATALASAATANASAADAHGQSLNASALLNSSAGTFVASVANVDQEINEKVDAVRRALSESAARVARLAHDGTPGTNTGAAGLGTAQMLGGASAGGLPTVLSAPTDSLLASLARIAAGSGAMAGDHLSTLRAGVPVNALEQLAEAVGEHSQATYGLEQLCAKLRASLRRAREKLETREAAWLEKVRDANGDLEHERGERERLQAVLQEYERQMAMVIAVQRDGDEHALEMMSHAHAARLNASAAAQIPSSHPMPFYDSFANAHRDRLRAEAAARELRLRLERCEEALQSTRDEYMRAAADVQLLQNTLREQGENYARESAASEERSQLIQLQMEEKLAREASESGRKLDQCLSRLQDLESKTDALKKALTAKEAEVVTAKEEAARAKKAMARVQNAFQSMFSTPQPTPL